MQKLFPGIAFHGLRALASASQQIYQYVGGGPRWRRPFSARYCSIFSWFAFLLNVAGRDEVYCCTNFTRFFSHCIRVWLPSVTITKITIVAMFVLLTLAYGDGWVAAWFTSLLAQLCQLMSALGWNSTVHCLPHMVMILPSNNAISEVCCSTGLPTLDASPQGSHNAEGIDSLDFLHGLLNSTRWCCL